MFKRFLFIVGMTAFLCLNVYAQNVKVNGVAQKGGTIVRTSSSTTYKLMETYPLCTVTVYNTGTTTLASIFVNEIGNPKPNPFSSAQDASFSFYIAPGRYDLKFSGIGIASPFTITDTFVLASSGGSGNGAVSSVFGRNGFVVAATNDYTWAQVDKTFSSLADLTTRSASDLLTGTLQDARFPAILPAISGQNLTNLNASNISSGTISDARLSANIPRLDAANVFIANNKFSASVGIGMSITPTARLEIADPGVNQLKLTNSTVTKSVNLSVDTGGSLNINPSGSVIFDTVGNHIDPLNTYEENLGSLTRKYLSLSVAELNVETLVAQNTMATIGGRILVGPTSMLIADLAPAAAVINVKYNNLASGDTVYMEGNQHVEFMTITSGPATITNGYSYTVTRNLDGSGADQWYVGDAIFDTGKVGNGFIDEYSTRGVRAGTEIGPTIAGNVRNTSTYNDWSTYWAIGNLNGLYGYSGDTYGTAFGKYDALTTHVTIDANSGANGGFRIFDGLSTVRMQIRSDGSGFLASNNISWDASGNTAIAGWTINAATITSAGSNVILDSSGAITAGAGQVVLDSTGIATRSTSSYAGNRSYRITDATGANLFGTLWALDQSAGNATVYLDTGMGNYAGNLVLAAYAPASSQATVYLSASDGCINKGCSGGTANHISLASTQGIKFGIGGNDYNMWIDANNNIRMGTAGTVSVNATTGFVYIPSMAGTPAGTPSSVTGKVPMVYDSTNNMFYIYNGGWKKVALAP